MSRSAKVAFLICFAFILCAQVGNGRELMKKNMIDKTCAGLALAELKMDVPKGYKPVRDFHGSPVKGVLFLGTRGDRDERAADGGASTVLVFRFTNHGNFELTFAQPFLENKIMNFSSGAGEKSEGIVKYTLLVKVKEGSARSRIIDVGSGKSTPTDIGIGGNLGIRFDMGHTNKAGTRQVGPIGLQISQTSAPSP